MNKTTLGIIAAALLIGGLVWLARPGSQNNTASSAMSSGALTVEETNNYDFGTISMSAGKVKRDFKIKNLGNEPVTINKMYTSCMCTTASLSIGDPSTGSGQVKRFGPYGMPGHGAIPTIGETLNPNEAATVEAVFDPAAHGPAGVGRVQRTIIVENNAGKPLEFGFTAFVTP